jgi:hypothetical protein
VALYCYRSGQGLVPVARTGRYRTAFRNMHPFLTIILSGVWNRYDVVGVFLMSGGSSDGVLAIRACASRSLAAIPFLAFTPRAFPIGLSFFIQVGGLIEGE